ncbi:Sensor histidine kinase LiaS [Rubripirellula tenax]|uniref:Sensor histidine kinase LiaS n=1 Tax=Rubripirellula tenax TaxID=2528015 RepID=A0A5C6EJ19_9BACT|nr:ATP-binding protein [Rubripirellula tenax]TWU48494.1 Sensor histidine kinase LiaS [Rubripirellula tenax]
MAANLPCEDDSERRIIGEIIEADRASIGNEIHDALAPYLFAASANLGRLQSDLKAIGSSAEVDQALARASQASELLDAAMKASRTLLTVAYPPELVGSLWTRAVRDTVQRLDLDSAAVFDWQLADSVNDISKPAAVACYRIVIEAIRNAIRHGKASRVAVVGQTIEDSNFVTITDDGRGFESTEVPAGHFGIKSMCGRATWIGGHVLVESKVGGPTVVRLEFPSSAT